MKVCLFLDIPIVMGLFFYYLMTIEVILILEEGVAPTVERWTPNPTVAGSNPVGLIFLIILIFLLNNVNEHQVIKFINTS